MSQQPKEELTASYSHSQTNTNSQEKELISMKRVSFVDEVLLPFISEFNRITSDNAIISNIFDIVFLCQILLASFYDFQTKKNVPHDLELIYKIVFIGHYGSFDERMLGYLIVIIVLIIMCLTSVYVIYNYNKTHEMNRTLMKIIRFTHVYMARIFILPFVFYESTCIAEISNNMNPTAIVFFSIGYTMIIYSYFHITIFFINIARTPYLPSRGSFSFQPDRIITSSILYVITFLIADIGKYFPYWYSFISPVLTLIVSLYYMIDWARFFVTEGIVFSSFAASMHYGIFLASAFSIVRQFIDIPTFIYYGIPMSNIFLVFPMILIFTKSRSSMIRDSLEKGLDHWDIRDEKEAILYLQIGLEGGCKSFLDWSLVNFLLENNKKNPKMLTILEWFVSFFPKELKLFEKIQKEVNNPNIQDKVLLYQLNRIHTNRKRSNSKEMKMELREIGKEISEVINEYRMFWYSLSNSNTAINPDIYWKLTTIRENMELKLKEFLEKYPRNYSIISDYARFLLNGSCHFKQAMIQYNRLENIKDEMGIDKDYMFVSFVQHYPKYVKQRVLSSNGKIRSESTKSSSFNSSKQKEKNKDSEYNPFNRNLTLHLLYEKAIKRFTFKEIKLLEIWSFVRLFVITLILIVYDSYYGLTLLSFRYFFQKEPYIDKVIFNQLLLGNQINWLTINNGESFYKEGITDNLTSILNNSATLQTNLFKLSSTYLNDLNLLYKSQREDNFPGTQYKDLLFNPIFVLPVCQQGNIPCEYLPNTATFDHLIHRSLVMIQQLSNLDSSELSNVKSTSTFASFINNHIELNHILMHITSSLVTDIELEGISKEISIIDDVFSSTYQNFNFSLTCLPFFLFIFVVPIVIILTVTLNLSIKQFSTLLKKVKQEDALQASNSLIKGDNTRLDHNTKNFDNKNFIKNSWLISLFITFTILFCMELASILYFYGMGQIRKLLETKILISAERNNVYMSLFISHLAIVSKEEDLKFVNQTELKELIKYILEKLEEIQNALTAGGDNSFPITQITSAVSSLRKNKPCYRKEITCNSMEGVIEYIISQIKKIQSSYDILHSTDDIFYELYSLLNSYLYHKYNNIIDEIYSKISSQRVIVIVYSLGLTLVCLVNGLIIFSIERNTIKKLYSLMQTIKSLLLRMDPLSFTNDKKLCMFVLQNMTIHSDKIKSLGEAAFRKNQNIFLLADGNGNITNGNPQVTKVFGLRFEHIIGQNFSFIFAKKDGENKKLYKAMENMRSGQMNLTFNIELIGTKDDKSLIHVSCILLGISKNNRIAESFVLICKDQTEEIAQKVAVEEAKRKTENLLEQILPKDIITRLGRGDKDISFSVPSASVAFIDIVQFSEYMRSVSAVDAMTTLSAVFSAFDGLLSKYPCVTKIKLIGDVYMAASGLFGECTPEEHACEMVRFCSDAIGCIESINERLASSLRVRVGVNSGGPLIAGVLGTDKPLFDIIGDVINVASRLNTSGVPGCIQISESTYGLVASLGLSIEERGLIELKGKGQTKTFLIHLSKENDLQHLLV